MDMNYSGRYLIRGFVDGLLSTLGVVIGASAAIGASTQAGNIIIAAGIGGGVANSLSNILGAFMAEKVRVGERMEKVEKAMLKEEGLRGTKVDERFQSMIMSGGIFDGLATIVGSIIPVLPFFMTSIFSLTELMALFSSLFLSLTIFFFLGVYVGRISKENIILSAFKMVAFAGGTALIAAIIRFLF